VIWRRWSSAGRIGRSWGIDGLMRMGIWWSGLWIRVRVQGLGF